MKSVIRDTCRQRIRMETLKRMRWAGLVAPIGKKIPYGILEGGESGGKRPLRSPYHRWLHDIKMNLRDMNLQ
jgi:hypothetical protein